MTTESGNPESARTTWILVGVIAVAGLVLRLWDLDARIFSHPENYASGLRMPEWMPIVARRVDVRSLLYGTLGDGHPPLYYATGLLWAKVLGTDIWALRLPSALLGAATILLVYAIGARVASRWVGVIAASLLALHGHHIFYSQLARLYVFAGFFAALSTWLFLRARASNRTRDHVAYALATACALWSHLYCWPVIFTQLVWSSLSSAARGVVPRVLVTQVIAILASTPVIALTLYQNPPTRWAEDATGYFGFGYALDRVVSFWSEPPSFPGGELWVRIALTLLLIGAGAGAVRRHPADEPRIEPDAGLSTRLWNVMLLGATAMAASIAFFATWVQPRETVSRGVLFGVAALPLVLAGGLPLALRYAAPAFLRKEWLVRLTRLNTFPVWLAFLPVACMIGVSLVRASFTARGTLVFLPFLLLAVSQGVYALFRWQWAGRASLAAVLLLSLLSVRHFGLAQSSPRDYAGLAASLRSVLAPDDYVLVRGNAYVDGPLLYYFPPPHAQFIGRDHAAELALRGHKARVWVITWHEAPINQDIQKALEGYRPGPVVNAFQATATAYLPQP